MSAITVANIDAVKLSLTPEAEQAKAKYLAEISAITTIEAATLQTGVDALAKGKKFLARLEESRKEVKAPVLDIGRKIDGIAKDFAEEIERQLARLKALVDDFNRREAAKLAAKQKMLDDLARKKREAEEKAAAEARQEAARLEKAAEQARTQTELTLIQQKADAAKAAAEEAELKASAVAAKTVQAPRADGMTVKKVWNHRITDIHALYKARPDLVSLEPRTNEINKAIRQDGCREIPGLDIYEATQTVIR